MQADGSLPEKLRSEFQLLSEQLTHTDRNAVYPEKIVHGLHGSVLLSLQSSPNGHLLTLTVDSVTFLPAPLITGIYGMTFRKAPEIHWYEGHPVAI